MSFDNLDNIDRKLLKDLQENSKITNTQLAQEVGLSPAPTLERVKKLEKNGYIQSYQAKVDPRAVGLELTALIQIALARQMENSINSFVEQIDQIPEIVEGYQLTGDFDYLLKAMVPDIPSFEQLISEKLSKVEEIGQMQTNVVLAKVKESKVLPLSYK